MSRPLSTAGRLAGVILTDIHTAIHAGRQGTAEKKRKKISIAVLPHAGRHGFQTNEQSQTG